MLVRFHSRTSRLRGRFSVRNSIVPVSFVVGGKSRSPTVLVGKFKGNCKSAKSRFTMASRKGIVCAAIRRNCGRKVR